MRCQMSPNYCFQITQEFLDYPWEGGAFAINKEENYVFEVAYPMLSGTVGDWFIFYSPYTWGIVSAGSFASIYTILED